VTVFRRGQGRQTLLVSVAELKEEGIAKSTTGPRSRATSNPGGLVLGELGAAQRRRLNLEHGVAIEGVEEGGARVAGLRPGDVVLEIDGKRVSTVADAQRLLAQLPRERPVVLRIQRGAATSFVALRLDG
jgi:serine protease Do